MLSGIIAINEDTVFEDNIVVKASAKFILQEGKSVVFRGVLDVRGTLEEPVVVTSSSDKPFGTFAILGPEASGSSIRHLRISNGSSGIVEGVNYLSMFSINNTSNITIDSLFMENNRVADDMIHIVYSDDVVLNNATLRQANLDAIDIDISNVAISNLLISHAGNDCLDLMSSTVVLRQSKLEGCRDKGASVGERSDLLIVNTQLSNSNIGVQAKDGSYVAILHSDLIDNGMQFSLYNKNWYYGRAENLIEVDKSYIRSPTNAIDVEKRSRVLIGDSTIVNGFTSAEGAELLGTNDFNDTRGIRVPKFVLEGNQEFVIPIEAPLKQRGAVN